MYVDKEEQAYRYQIQFSRETGGRKDVQDRMGPHASAASRRHHQGGLPLCHRLGRSHPLPSDWTHAAGGPARLQGALIELATWSFDAQQFPGEGECHLVVSDEACGSIALHLAYSCTIDNMCRPTVSTVVRTTAALRSAADDIVAQKLFVEEERKDAPQGDRARANGGKEIDERVVRVLGYRLHGRVEVVGEQFKCRKAVYFIVDCFVTSAAEGTDRAVCMRMFMCLCMRL